MRVADRGELHALASTRSPLLLLEPAVLDGLAVELRAGIRRGERHLDRVRIDLLRVLDRLLDRLVCFARQAEDESAVNLDAELSAVRGEAPRDVRAQALFDVLQDLVVAGSRSRPAAGAGRSPS